MGKKYKIGIWGQFGDGGDIADGQAVRTTIITEELERRYGKENVLRVNTNGWYKRKIGFLFDSIGLLSKAEKVVILPADNGFKVVVQLYNILNKFFKKELLYVVIGGFLPALLKEKPKYLPMLKKYEALFVQTSNLKKDLEALGLDNIHILSNLKRLNTRKEEELSVNQERTVKVCTLSRINEDKGIDYAVEAVKKANEALGADLIHLDIFGMVADNYKEHFDTLLSENSEFVSYGGVLKYNKTSDTLSEYFALLFPTFYYGEGFPGNVVDAYNAGLPILATDWLYNKDVIENGVNGILVPIKDSDALSDALLSLYNNRELHYEISVNNVRAAAKYTPDEVLKEFYTFIDK